MFQLTRRDAVTGMAAMVAVPLAARARPEGRLLHRDDFRQGIGHWSAEAEAPARVEAVHGILEIDAPAGLTLWFRPELQGRVAIDYDVQAVADGGPHDRVSDVNCFWMAQDPAAPDGDALARPRSGRFEEYDDLRTYYVGLGGNANTTTRFRRYIARRGERPLLPENDRQDAADLLVANRWQHLRLVADGRDIGFFRDGRRLFAFKDTEPYMRGHFALRTTASHLRVRNFTVSALA